MEQNQKIFEIKINDDELKALFLDEIHKRLNEIEYHALLLDSKQLCKMLSLSWPTVEKYFLSDRNFPKYRIGTKWVFHRKEVEKYIEHWSITTKHKL